MDTGDLTFFLHVFSNVLTKHRQYPKQLLGGVELSHLMNGATDVARNVAVDVAEACLRSCPKQVTFREHSGNIQGTFREHS
jgi:hypothetical protein